MNYDCCSQGEHRIRMELNLCSFCLLSGFLLVVLAMLWMYSSKAKKSKTVSPGVVLLHQFEPMANMVNLSPPCLKLETYLRMAKIPYENDYGRKMSSKGKCPWIEYNGQAIADSYFCIKFLSKEFKVDIDAHLTEEQKSISTALFVMLEENTYWTLVYDRWCTLRASEFRKIIFGSALFPLGNVIFWMFQRRIRRSLYGHGIGRHSEEEIYGIAERDLRAVSTYLGEKKFLFGDQPSLVDAVLFALVANFIWFAIANPQAKVIKSDLKNLADHSQRMKERFYPDWEEIISGKAEKKKSD